LPFAPHRKYLENYSSSRLIKGIRPHLDPADGAERTSGFPYEQANKVAQKGLGVIVWENPAEGLGGEAADRGGVTHHSHAARFSLWRFGIDNFFF
jgi:hypothetical protein